MLIEAATAFPTFGTSLPGSGGLWDFLFVTFNKNICKSVGNHPCHQIVCDTLGKHPRIPDWEKKATTDEATIREWWRMWPASNVGIATGRAFGMVLDVDPRNGGLDALAALEEKHGKLPETLTADTGGDGVHYVSENDNAEVVRKVIRPLKELAVAGNCAVWASHHIGKAGESDDAEEAYRGRGASAFGANVRGVITMRKEKALGDGYVRLTLGKSKGNKLNPVNLKLDFAKRTFEICAAAPQAQTP
jgi:hypothetical protein